MATHEQRSKMKTPCISDVNKLNSLTDFDLSTLNSAGCNRTTTGDGEDVLHSHQERLINRTLRRRNVAVDLIHQRQNLVNPLVFTLNSRRGQIEGMGSEDSIAKVSAKVPLAEMFGYATDIRSKTQGRGIFSMEFSHYDEVPRNVAEAIIAKSKGNA